MNTNYRTIENTIQQQQQQQPIRQNINVCYFKHSKNEEERKAQEQPRDKREISPKRNEKKTRKAQ